MPHILQSKCGLVKGVISLEGEDYVVFHNLSGSEIWLDKKGSLWWEGPDNRWITVLFIAKLDQDWVLGKM